MSKVRLDWICTLSPVKTTRGVHCSEMQVDPNAVGYLLGKDNILQNLLEEIGQGLEMKHIANGKFEVKSQTKKSIGEVHRQLQTLLKAKKKVYVDPNAKLPETKESVTNDPDVKASEVKETEPKNPDDWKHVEDYLTNSKTNKVDLVWQMKLNGQAHEINLLHSSAGRCLLVVDGEEKLNTKNKSMKTLVLFLGSGEEKVKVVISWKPNPRMRGRFLYTLKMKEPNGQLKTFEKAKQDWLQPAV